LILDWSSGGVKSQLFLNLGQTLRASNPLRRPNHSKISTQSQLSVWGSWRKRNVVIPSDLGDAHPRSLFSSGSPITCCGGRFERHSTQSQLSLQPLHPSWRAVHRPIIASSGEWFEGDEGLSPIGFPHLLTGTISTLTQPETQANPKRYLAAKIWRGFFYQKGTE